VNDALQFDHAEYTGDQPLTCGSCEHTIAHVYHEMNGRLFCDRCRRNVEIAVNSGSRLSRAIRAIVAGSAAAVVGSLVYFGVTKLTGYELSLVTIFIGYIVGVAVRWGSNGRGGWAYQALAILLTYFAIVSTYAPTVVEAMVDASRRQAEQVSTAQAPAAATAHAADGKASIARFAAMVAVLSLIVCVAPFLLGVKNLIGLVIIGVGLYQAWKMNRRLTLNFSGPHRIRGPEAAATPVV
jgi:hypothetical protein